MKRIITCAVLALALCGLSAEAQSPAAPAATAAALPSGLQEFNAVMTELTQVLSAVTDKASADAAVPAVKALEARMDACKAAVESEAENMSEEERAMFALSMLGGLSNLMQHAERLQANNYYGSAALAEALMGSAADEDEE